MRPDVPVTRMARRKAIARLVLAALRTREDVMAFGRSDLARRPIDLAPAPAGADALGCDLRPQALVGAVALASACAAASASWRSTCEGCCSSGRCRGRWSYPDATAVRVLIRLMDVPIRDALGTTPIDTLAIASVATAHRTLANVHPIPVGPLSFPHRVLLSPSVRYAPPNGCC
jgi:hypothetical protein